MNIAICGFGRAAKALCEKILAMEGYNLVMVLCRENSKNAYKDIGEIVGAKDSGQKVSIIPISEAVKNLEGISLDLIVDFSHQEMAFPLIELCGAVRANLIICTTNHSIEEISRFEHLAEHYGIGIAYCPNLTVGINLLMDFCKKISQVCPDFDFEIIEMHPSDKKKPTATARMLSQAAGRENVPIHSVRLDGYVGVHKAIATDGVERIILSHESLSRQAFANGAILAAEFLKGKHGFYLMRDIITDLEERAAAKGNK